MKQENFNKLTQLVDTFGVQNDSLKELKKVCEEQNKAIKEIMAEECLDYFCTDDYKASYTLKENTKVDEDKLLGILVNADEEKFESLRIIQTRKCVSAEDLEAAIYNGLIDKDLLIKIKECYTTNRVPTLTVKRKGAI